MRRRSRGERSELPPSARTLADERLSPYLQTRPGEDMLAGRRSPDVEVVSCLLPECVERILIGVMAADLLDQALTNRYQLTRGYIERLSSIGSRGMLHRDNEAPPDRDIDEVRAKRLTR